MQEDRKPNPNLFKQKWNIWAHLNENSWNMSSFRPGLTKGTTRWLPDSVLLHQFPSFPSFVSATQRGRWGSRARLAPLQINISFPGDPATAPLSVYNVDPVLVTKPVTVTGECHELIGQNHRPEPFLELKMCAEDRGEVRSSERH